MWVIERDAKNGVPKVARLRPQRCRGERNRRVCPHPQPTRWSGERYKLPQQVLGRALDKKRVLVHCELETFERTHVATKISIFDTFVTYKIALI